MSIALNMTFNGNKLHKTFNSRSRDMLNFNFLRKGRGIVSPPHFVYDFSKKDVSHFILLTDQVRLSDAFTSQDIGQCVL